MKPTKKHILNSKDLTVIAGGGKKERQARRIARGIIWITAGLGARVKRVREHADYDAFL